MNNTTSTDSTEINFLQDWPIDKRNILNKIFDMEWSSNPTNNITLANASNWDYKATLSYYIGMIYALKRYFNDINDLTYFISSKITLSHLFEIENNLLENIKLLTKSNEQFNGRQIVTIGTDANRMALRHLEDINQVAKYFKDCWLIYDNYPTCHYNRYIQKNLNKSIQINSAKTILQRYLIKIQLDIEIYVEIHNQTKHDLRKNDSIITISSADTSTDSKQSMLSSSIISN